MWETCPECDGEGFILDCCDDICNGLGECIHGDGERVCPVCEGSGEVWEEQADYYEITY